MKSPGRISALPPLDYQRRIFRQMVEGPTMLRSGLFVVSVISIGANYALEAKAEIRIAVAGAMTGANAWFGEQYQRGAELAVADLNAKGASSARASN
jgi:ABC-type branched-subunit amino acid transport system substrate-binding protein